MCCGLVFGQMARGVRTTDFLARYGGDELTLILSQTEMSSAQIVSEKIVEGMKKLKYKLPDGKRLKLGSPVALPSFPSMPAMDQTSCAQQMRRFIRPRNINAAPFQIARGITGPLASHQDRRRIKHPIILRGL